METMSSVLYLLSLRCGWVIQGAVDPGLSQFLMLKVRHPRKPSVLGKSGQLDNLAVAYVSLALRREN